MKSSAARIILASCGCLLALVQQVNATDAVAGAPLATNDPVLIEARLVASVYTAALTSPRGVDVTASLTAASPFPTPMAPSVLLARRAMSVCSLLQSDNEYGRAMRLAEDTLARLADMQETTDADRVERLYWEALLEGWVLDQKAQAVVTLEAARKIKPDDDRILDLEHDLTKALSAFGR